SAGRDAALARGQLLHRLMQSLPDIPAERRAEAAHGYLARAIKNLSEETRESFVKGDELEILQKNALTVLENSQFRALFSPGSRAEVPIVGNLPQGRVSGQIDRLAVTPEAVWIGDFKTNRPAPRRIEDVPPGYIVQLALYRAVLAKLYPDRPIRAALVWTEVPDLMELSAKVLDVALAQVTTL
ncbi:MAG: PD-(D/E)XK nuclease family protein, partial [Pseudolabrys sp.]